MAELNLGRVKGEKGERGLTEEEEQAIIQVKNETIQAKEEAISATGELEQIKTEVDVVKNQTIGATENANDKIVDVENRFQSLTTEQQGDSEVIDARQGKASLVENIQQIKDSSYVKDLKNDKSYSFGLQLSAKGNPQIVYKEVL